MIIERHRTDYKGEFVITETKWSKGKKSQKREWIDNPIINQHLSHRAACIASGLMQHRFDHRKLQNHRGGLLSSKKLQTYGTVPITRDMRLDFAVSTQQTELDEILNRRYQENNIVYTTANLCIGNPGEFYLIPYNPILSVEALVLYLAAFDGHKEIFMLGYNNDTPSGNSGWKEHVNSVIAAYQTSTFTCVGRRGTVPEQWADNANFQMMTEEEFISYCDI